MGTQTRWFRFDFPDFRIGTAEYPEGPTGCTVAVFPKPAVAVVDVRGGAASLRDSDLLHPQAEWSEIDALVLSGGSSYGQESAAGVMQRILESRKRSVKFADIPTVPAAVVYDFSGRDNAIYPDIALGRKAFDVAKTGEVLIGRAGAGANVSVGKFFGRKYSEPSGQGAAFLEKDGMKLFALTVVNSVGNILGKDGKVIAGTRDPVTGTRETVGDRLMRSPGTGSAGTPGNTTISMLITNVKMDRLRLQRVAVMAHTAMGRVIDPFHSPQDGDALFVVSTRSVESPTGIGASELGVMGGRLLQDSVIEVFGV